uniref:Zona pellucida sperm-binding protein 3 n=1 Tax=Myripristis murdjan TaxID=586833 RepID=A0A668A9H5_9TELE
MGLRVLDMLGFLLLLSGGALSSTHNWLNYISNSNETLNQIPQEPVRTASQLPRSPHTSVHQSKQTEQRNPLHFPKSYQLRKPAVTVQNPQRLEARKLTSEQPELRQTVQAPVRSPGLNPAVKQEPKVLVRFEQRVPVPADSVAVRCGEGGVTVEVKQNFLGNGQLINPRDLTLGGCAALDTSDHILLFQTELQGCGSIITVTEEALIYAFSLIYLPTPIRNTVILKTNPAEVVIECHYPRRQFVSSDAVQPAWKPFASNVLAEGQLHFSLRLMTEDWQSERPSSVYFLSDVMHIEASVLQARHVPLRLYVDGCVAAPDPSPDSQPRYPFITNHGCLTDAKLTGAKSYFMQRSQEDKLQFQLKAFRFKQDRRTSLYITCHLKATTVSVPVDSVHKACSFLTEANRWVASGGDNKVCSCCETSCTDQRRKRSLAADTDFWVCCALSSDLQWEGTAALGPILVQDNMLLEELMELSEFPPEPAALVLTHQVTPAASSPSPSLLCGVAAALGVVLLLCMGAVIYSRLRKPTGHSVVT